MATKIQLRRDLDTNWNSANPTLSEGEPGFETNTGKFKIGDGNTQWNSLPYATASGSGSGIGLTDLSVTDLGGAGSLTYNSSTGAFTYTGPNNTEIRSAFTAGTGISISGGVISATSSGGISLTSLSASSSGDGSLSYNNTTGVFTYTGPGISNYRAAFTAGAGIDITSGVISTTGSGGIGLSDLSAVNVSGDGTLAYDSSSGTFSYTGPSATNYRAAFTAGTGITITGGQIASTITQYADSNARAAVSVSNVSGDGTLAYNSGTGIISYTGPSVTNYRAAFTAGTGISISGGVISATGGGGSGTVTSVSGTGTVNGLTLSGTVTSSGSLTLGGTLSGIANSALTNSSVTFNGKTASLGSSATINLADLGTVTISSPTNGQVLKYNGTAWVNGTDSTGGAGTTYSISAETATGGVNLRLTGSDASTDDVKLAAGSNITLTRTDANTITIASSSGGGSGIALTDLSVTDAGGDGSLSYNNSTGVFTYTGPSATEVRSHFSAGTGINISGGTISSTVVGGSTDFDFGSIAPTTITNTFELLLYCTTIDIGTITNPAGIAYDAGTLV